ncbi:MAG TPA: nitroreductase [Cyclobacteriaceae bacterium]|nr:nitroreductase [Cyclobacteriaceae bacterium]
MKTIYFRRAVRKFAPTPVNKKLLDEIFEAGRQAPSAMNRQPWKFYVVTNPQKIKAISAEIAEAAKDKLHLAEEIAQSTREDFIFHGSPVVIFITAPLDSEWAPMDVGMCAQNMMLAAKSLGLDSCPVGFGRYVEKTKSYSDLKIPPSEKVQLALLIGFGAENPITKPRVKDNVFYLD